MNRTDVHDALAARDDEERATLAFVAAALLALGIDDYPAAWLVARGIAVDVNDTVTVGDLRAVLGSIR